jgi:hypothetical protein
VTAAELACRRSGDCDAQSTAAIFFIHREARPVFAGDRARGGKALESHAMRPFKRGAAAAKAE